MPEEPRLSKKSKLAIAIAQGTSVASWARQNDVPKRTAYRWAADPKVRTAAEACRRRTIDRAVGRMTRRATWAADGIATLAKEAESESVRLSALRAILSEMMSVSHFSGLEGRMAQIEDQLRERTGDADSAG
jgi:hypothetical protein